MRCVNCNAIFKEKCHEDIIGVSDKFCSHCNNNMNKTLILTSIFSSISAGELIYCGLINVINNNTIFDLKDLKNKAIEDIKGE